MQQIIRTGVMLAASLAFASTAIGGGHKSGGEGSNHSKRQIGQYSGFEGSEAELGAAVVAAIAGVKNSKGETHDFSGRELEVGLAASKMIKTLGSASGYPHEMNDALVKMTLEFMQHAKKEGRLEEVAREDALTQFPMLSRVGKIVEASGRKELALVAITDQTTCFFQLAGEIERGPGYVRYRAPYGHVLKQTTRMGMHDLSEQEIHEKWTMPHIEVWSEMLGVDIQISEWQEDGMITLSVPELTEAMAANAG
jgi:hypothetical protein